MTFPFPISLWVVMSSAKQVACRCDVDNLSLSARMVADKLTVLDKYSCPHRIAGYPLEDFAILVEPAPIAAVQRVHLPLGRVEQFQATGLDEPVFHHRSAGNRQRFVAAFECSRVDASLGGFKVLVVFGFDGRVGDKQVDIAATIFLNKVYRVNNRLIVDCVVLGRSVVCAPFCRS